MSAWEIAGIIIGLLLVLLILANARDVYRYLKITFM